MACSRIPKWMIRPKGLAFFMRLSLGRKEPPPSIVVLLLSARSADPPQNSGSEAAIACMTLPEAALVAISLSLEKIGKSSSHFSGNFLVSNLSNNLALSGFLSCQIWKFFSHALKAFDPRSLIFRACVMTSLGA